jgi:hypothetical protein
LLGRNVFCLRALAAALHAASGHYLPLLLLLCRWLLLVLLVWQTLTSSQGSSCRSCRQLRLQMQLPKEPAACTRQQVVSAGAGQAAEYLLPQLDHMQQLVQAGSSSSEGLSRAIGSLIAAAECCGQCAV